MSFFSGSSSSSSGPPVLTGDALVLAKGKLSGATPSIIRRHGHRPKSKVALLVRGLTVLTKMYSQAIPRPMPRLTHQDAQSLIVNLTIPPATFLLSSVTVPTFNAQSFALASCPGAGEYTALFDDYKILQLECWIDVVGTTGSNTVVGDAVVCVDRDDATVPVSYSSVANHQSAVQMAGQNGCYFRFVPYMALAAFSGTFTSYTSTPPEWLDCASPGVAHYGLKIAALAMNPAIIYQVTSRLTIEFGRPGI